MTAIASLLETALYSKLTSGTALAALVSTRIYDTHVPASGTYPLVLFQHVAGGDTNSSPRRDVDVQFRVEAMARSAAEARQIAGFIDDLLHEQELTITGWSNYRLVAEALFNRVDQDEMQQVFRKGAIYRISVDKNG